MTQTLTAEEFFLTLDLSFLVFLFAEVGVSAQEPPVRTRNADSGEQAGATIPHESSTCCKILSSRGSWRAVPGHGDMESLRNDVQKRWIFDKSSAVVFNGVALKTHQSNFEKTKKLPLDIEISHPSFAASRDTVRPSPARRHQLAQAVNSSDIFRPTPRWPVFVIRTNLGVWRYHACNDP